MYLWNQFISLLFTHACTHTHITLTQQKKDEGGSSVSKSVVFNKQPDPVEWHLARNKDEYNLLTVSSTNYYQSQPITPVTKFNSL